MTCYRQIAHVHRRFATTSPLVVSRTCQSRASRARYQPDNHENVDSDFLAGLLEQARQTPVVNIPGTAPAVGSQQFQRQQRRGRIGQLEKEHEDASSMHPARDSSKRSYKATTRLSAEQLQQCEQELEQQQDSWHSLPQRRIRPSSMNFEAMYQQLAQWKSLYLTAHVPRFCFDAPELGAWVRYMRKQHKEGLLELWKVDRLNTLEFEWELSDQDAKWHYKYHQLRRYLLLYGTTNVDPGTGSADYCDWMMIVRWLTKQARLLAKRRLSGQKCAMLEQLGVTLRLPKRLVHRTAQLQALNGMERRKLRKKWKAMDMELAQQQQQQRRMEWEQRRQQQRQQQWVTNRRLAVLQESQVLEGGRGTRAAEDSDVQQQQQLADLQQLLQQQQQQQQQLLDIETQAQEDQPLQLAHHQQLLQQQQQQQPTQLQGLLPQQQQLVSSGAGVVPSQLQLLAGQHPAAQILEVPSSTADSSAGIEASDTAHLGGSLAAAAAAGTTAGTAAASTTAPSPEAVGLQHLQQQQTLQPAGQPRPTQQQQQQHQEALFWRRNRRGRNVRQKSRQEKWLRAQQSD